MSRQDPFALPTIDFICQKTTDSNPFGDKSRVKSDHVGPHAHAALPTTAALAESHRLRDLGARALGHRQAESHTAANSRPLDDDGGDLQLVKSIKQRLLHESNPANLINVLLFWINFQVSRGMPNHIQCVLNVLQDMKKLFVARNTPSNAVLEDINDILCALVNNVGNDDYDSTESVVAFVQVVGAYFMRDYLIERHVVLEDANATDMLTTWVTMQYILTNKMPLAAPNAHAEQDGKKDTVVEILKCMSRVDEEVQLASI